MTKVYISLPMANQEDTIWSRYEIGIERAKKILGEDIEIHGPINIEQFKNGRIERDHPYSWYIGEDIKELMECDMIWMCEGYEKSKGCQLELSAAKIYNKEIYFADFEYIEDIN